MKTFSAKAHEVNHEWFVVDAKDQVLGRLAARIAHVLRGKHKAIYTPHVDTGDFIVVTSADKLVVTGKKEQSLVETEKYTKIEMAYGKFERKFNLPSDIEKEFIDGKIENGILYVEIPKKIEEVQEDSVIKVNIR